MTQFERYARRLIRLEADARAAMNSPLLWLVGLGSIVEYSHDMYEEYESLRDYWTDAQCQFCESVFEDVDICCSVGYVSSKYEAMAACNN